MHAGPARMKYQRASLREAVPPPRLEGVAFCFSSNTAWHASELGTAASQLAVASRLAPPVSPAAPRRATASGAQVGSRPVSGCCNFPAIRTYPTTTETPKLMPARARILPLRYKKNNHKTKKQKTNNKQTQQHTPTNGAA